MGRRRRRGNNSITLKRHNGSATLSVASSSALTDGIDFSTHAGKVQLIFSINGAADIPVTFTGANVSSVILVRLLQVSIVQVELIQQQHHYCK